jgi:transposase
MGFQVEQVFGRRHPAALSCDRLCSARQDGWTPQIGARPHRAFIKERLGQTPHLTLHALKDELTARGVKISHNAIWLFLRRSGLRFKKNAVRP